MTSGTTGPSPFSKVCQIGIVVRDLDQAIEHFEALGIGPFERSTTAAPIIDRMVHGKPALDVANRISCTHIADLEVEIVQPLSGQSVQKEFLETRGEGINHLGFVVSDLQAEVAKLTDRGFRVISSGRTTTGVAFAYLDTDRVGGIIFELIQPAPKS